MLSRVAHDQVLADGVPVEVVSVTPSLLLTGWRIWQREPELLSWTRRGQLRPTLAGHQGRGCGSLMMVEPHGCPLAFL